MELSRIGLGCVTFGREIDQASSFQVLDRALELGINFFDTAEAYGGGQARAARLRQQGLGDEREVSGEFHSSEITLGRWLSERGCRERIVLQTKVSPPLGGRRVLESLEASLRRLQTDHVDFLLLHAFDKNTPLLETIEALAAAVESGQARHIGCSNFSANQLADALELAEQRNLPQLQALQCNYNLVMRDAEQDLFPLCRQRQISVQTYSPLAAGFLTGKYNDGSIPAGSRFHVLPGHTGIYFKPEKFEIASRLNDLSRKLQVPAPRLAMAWVLKNPSIDTVLIGARHDGHIMNALEALAQPFDEGWQRELFNSRSEAPVDG
jgi:1-deoxyxylulose-5-phosphate synthase